MGVLLGELLGVVEAVFHRCHVARIEGLDGLDHVDAALEDVAHGAVEPAHGLETVVVEVGEVVVGRAGVDVAEQGHPGNHDEKDHTGQEHLASQFHVVEPLHGRPPL